MSRFALLKDLTRKTSSEERRELLCQVTDVLCIGPRPSSKEVEELDEMLALASRDFAISTREEIAGVIAPHAQFRVTANLLALDELSAAAPILKGAAHLSEKTLLQVVYTKSKDHMLLVSQRPDITAALSDALVNRGDDNILSSLLSNARAQIAMATFETIADRSLADVGLQEKLVRRQEVPAHVLSQLYLEVEAALRQEIHVKFSRLSEAELAFALERARSRTAWLAAKMPDDYPAARRRLRQLRMQGPLQPHLLMTLLREGPSSRTAFALVLSELTEVSFKVISRIISQPDLEALALIARASAFDRALFVSLAIGLSRSTETMARATDLGTMYEAVPVVTAQREISFWKPARNTG